MLNSDAIDAVTTWAKFVCLCSLIIMFANGVIFIWRLRTRHVAVWDRLGRTGMLLWQGPWLSQEARSFMKNREFLQLGDPLIRLTWRVNRVLGFLIIACSLWVFIAANLTWSR